jgi:hypothetical protein
MRFGNERKRPALRLCRIGEKDVKRQRNGENDMKYNSDLYCAAQLAAESAIEMARVVWPGAEVQFPAANPARDHPH